MTTAEKKLCHDLAEAEGEQVSEDGKYVIHSGREDNRRWKGLPFLIEWYLTDSAETLRMFISLIEWADIRVSEFDELLTLELYRRSDDEEIEECEPWKHLRFVKGGGWFEDGAFPLAVAQAHLARLKETK